MPTRILRVPPERVPNRSASFIRVYEVVALVVFLASGLVIWKAQEVSYETRLYMASVVVGVLVVGVFGGYWVAAREGVRRRRLSMEYILDEDCLTVRRPGWADVTIPLNGITTVFEHPRKGLRILAPPAWADIPREVDGFEELRTRLLQERQTSQWPGSSSPPLTVVSTLLQLTALGLIFLSHDPRVVIPSTVIVVVAGGRSAYWMWKRFDSADLAMRKKMGLLLACTYGLTLVGLLWVTWGKLR